VKRTLGIVKSPNLGAHASRWETEALGKELVKGEKGGGKSKKAPKKEENEMSTPLHWSGRGEEADGIGHGDLSASAQRRPTS